MLQWYLRVPDVGGYVVDCVGQDGGVVQCCVTLLVLTMSCVVLWCCCG